MGRFSVAVGMVVCLSVPAAAKVPAKKSAAPALPVGSLVPVVGYVPHRGDEVQLYYRDSGGTLRDVLAALDGRALDKVLVSMRARDPEGIQELKADKRVLSLPSGTFVRIIEPGDRRNDRNGYYEAEYVSIKVRILNGVAKGREVYVHPLSVQKLREVTPPAKKKVGRRAW